MRATGELLDALGLMKALAQSATDSELQREKQEEEQENAHFAAAPPDDGASSDKVEPALAGLSAWLQRNLLARGGDDHERRGSGEPSRRPGRALGEGLEDGDDPSGAAQPRRELAWAVQPADPPTAALASRPGLSASFLPGRRKSRGPAAQPNDGDEAGGAAEGATPGTATGSRARRKSLSEQLALAQSAQAAMLRSGVGATPPARALQVTCRQVAALWT